MDNGSLLPLQLILHYFFFCLSIVNKFQSDSMIANDILVYLWHSFQVDVKWSIEDGEKRFNQLSIEERGKFDEETLVNVNNIKRQSSTIKRASGFSNEYIVVRPYFRSYSYC